MRFFLILAMLIFGKCFLSAAPADDKNVNIFKVNNYNPAPIFPLGVYWPWEERRTGENAEIAGIDRWTYTEKVMQLLKKNHCNFIWVIHMKLDNLQRFCQLAQKYSLKVVMSADVYRNTKIFSAKEMDMWAKKVTRAAMNLDALIGYVGHDEPKGREMQVMNTLQDCLYKYDKKRFFTLVVRPHEVPLAMRHLNAKIITTDPYCFFYPGVPWYKDTSQQGSMKRYVRRISTAGRLAGKYGHICWSMPQAFAQIWPGAEYFDEKTKQFVIMPKSVLSFRMTTPEELSWQVWTALAHGIKGIIPFALLDCGVFDKKTFDKKNIKVTEHNNPRGLKEKMYSPQGFALIERGLQTTPQFKRLTECYRQLTPLLDILKNNYLSTQLILCTNGNMSAGTFKNSINGKLYAIIVNNNLNSIATERIATFNCIKKVKDLITNKNISLETSPKRKDLKQFSLSLPPGGGTVLELDVPETDYTLLDHIDFTASESKDNHLGKQSGLQVVSVNESERRNHLAVAGGSSGYVEYALNGDWIIKRFNPEKYGNGNIYVAVDAVGEVDIVFADAKGTEYRHPWQGLPMKVPVKASKFKILLNSTSSKLYSIELIYSACSD